MLVLALLGVLFVVAVALSVLRKLLLALLLFAVLVVAGVSVALDHFDVIHL